MALLFTFLPKPDSGHCLETAVTSWSDKMWCQQEWCLKNWHDFLSEAGNTDLSATVCLCCVAVTQLLQAGV